VAVFVDVLTDNRNRTSADVRHLFTKQGGSMAEPGAVAWQFERKGVISVDKATSEDDLMLVALDAGAEDIVDEGDTWRVSCEPSLLTDVRSALESAGIGFASADVTFLPKAVVELATAEAAKKVLRLIDALDEHDDIQDVYANFDIPDEILQLVDA
jgi:YebC/PmpR family DNA-binding regulatory protein